MSAWFFRCNDLGETNCWINIFVWMIPLSIFYVLINAAYPYLVCQTQISLLSFLFRDFGSVTEFFVPFLHLRFVFCQLAVRVSALTSLLSDCPQSVWHRVVTSTSAILTSIWTCRKLPINSVQNLLGVKVWLWAPKSGTSLISVLSPTIFPSRFQEWRSIAARNHGTVMTSLLSLRRL